jgi:hypothetical protein
MRLRDTGNETNEMNETELGAMERGQRGEWAGISAKFNEFRWGDGVRPIG